MIIDFHAHVLPGVDHGCTNTEMSLRQISAASDAGVKILCATSHFYPHADSVSSFIRRRSASWETIADCLPDNSPKIILGAETLVCAGMEHMEGLSQLMFGSGVLLLEMPTIAWSGELIDTVEAISHICKNKLVLAHVDRYPPQDMELLLNYGIFGQINASALCSPFGRQRLFKWIDAGKIAAIGSDVHGLGKSYSVLSKAVSILGNRIDEITRSSADLLGVCAAPY